MRHSPSEKLEIIRVVEESSLGVKRTLRELDVNRSTFYAWYERYLRHGAAGLEDRISHRRRFWNAIPLWVKKKVVETALEHLDKSPRELAWYLTDTQGYFISESSVYRILKVNDLITHRPIRCCRRKTSSISRRPGSISCGRPTSPT